MARAKNRKTQNKLCDVRFNSVSNTTAQYPSSCDVVRELNAGLMLNVANFLSDTSVYIASRIALDLMLNSGCRVSEILNISHSDILGGGKVRIKGLKGSCDRIIISSRFSKELEDYRNNCVSPFYCFSRFMLYRDFKKHGIYMMFKGAKLNSVTHACRHLYVSDLKMAGLSDAEIQGNIGHKSKKSTEHYVAKIAKRKQ